VEAEAALVRTTEQMPALKEAGVVDAGGKGFVRMLEGVVRAIDGDPTLTTIESNGTGSPPTLTFDYGIQSGDVSADLDYAGRSVKGQLTQAGRTGARTVVIIRREAATIRREGLADVETTLAEVVARLTA